VTALTLSTCVDCPLHLTAHRVVPGEGPVPSTYMFIAEAPGEQEDVQGRPLVGKSGRTFDRLLSKYAELDRASVYVTNVVKHRPPRNRTPRVAEVRTCMQWLRAELSLVRPRTLVTMGAVALHVFLPGVRISAVHGRAQLIEYEGVAYTLVPWYHPAYGLRSPQILEVMIEDARKLVRQADNDVWRDGDAGQPRNAQYKLHGDGGNSDDVRRGCVQDVGFDTETTSPSMGGRFATDLAELVGYSTSYSRSEGEYIPFDSRCTRGVHGRTLGEEGSGSKGMATLSTYNAAQLEYVLGNKLILHNSKFEYKVLAKTGFTLGPFDNVVGSVEDTKMGAYLLGEYDTSLKGLARKYLGTTPTEIDVLWPEGISDQPYAVAYERYKDNYPYACADADNTRRLWTEVIREKLVSENLWHVYKNIEMPLVPVLGDMEMRGIKLDIPAAQELLRTYDETRRMCKNLVRSLLEPSYVRLQDRCKFNAGSDTQVGKALVRMGAPLYKRTKGKKVPMMTAETLTHLRTWNADIIDVILTLKQLTKYQGYVKGFLAFVHPDGRLHPSINQAGHPGEEVASRQIRNAPTTGRLSTSGPSVQNIPHHDAEGWWKDIRRLIVPTPGYVFVTADLEQEEPRIIAHVAQDKELLRAFAAGTDIYRTITEDLYPYTIGNYTDVQFKEKYYGERFIGKTFFLSWYYGAGLGRLLRTDYTLSRAGATSSLARLTRSHPERATYLEGIKAYTEQHGFVSTLFGRKRWIPEIYVPGKVEDGLRKAANAKIQGTAADIIKLAMVYIYRHLSVGVHMLIQVHDELIFEALPTEVDKLKELVVQSFKGHLPLDLPVSFSTGPTWGDV
jgi:uracil-DNA glycosylase family 4